MLQRPGLQDISVETTPRPPLTLRYLNRCELRALRTDPDDILAVIGFGADRPDFLPALCPFIAAPLTPVAGETLFEVWSTPGQCRPVSRGPVTGACNDDYILGAVTLDETGDEPLEAVAEAAYRAIFDFLDAAGFAAPIRFWNYLTAITKPARGLERYRRFNIGRHQAFAARLRQGLPPAASAVGGHSGRSVIYFLGAHHPARNVENPRQVSAYDYPMMHGPRSPSFSRASVHALGPAETMFVSGTASITGHETRHAGDLPGQLRETLANLEALIDAASRPTGAGARWAFKIYLDDPSHRGAVDAALGTAFGSGCGRFYLRGDICRPELLLEIEAFHQVTR